MDAPQERKGEALTAPRLPVRMPRAAAAACFNRRRFANLFGLLSFSRCPADPPPTSARGVPRLELVWLPAYAITFRVRSNRGSGQVTVSVDTWSGASALFQRTSELNDVPIEEPVETFPPGMGEEDAVNAGRAMLLKHTLRRRGGKPAVEETAQITLFYAPYWVYYFRRGRFIDLKVIDAYQGSLTGGRIRTGMLNAMIAQHKARKAKATSSSG